MLFYNKDEKEKLKSKWRNVFVENCTKCSGTGFYNEDGKTKQCSCMKKAIKCFNLELSNIPVVNFNVSKEDVIRKVNYDFNDYFEIIQNEVFKTKNLYLYNISITVNSEIVAYIARTLIDKENKLSKKQLRIQYVVYEDLVQLSLKQNSDKEAKDRLNDLFRKPDVLFIDNVGAETGFGNASKHNIKLLQLILKTRYNDVKSTIISSKLNYSDVEKFYSEDVIELISTYDFVKGID
jgi:DNA replication protein DnaC